MTNLYPFLAYVFVTTFTPGPNNVMAMSNAMRSGYRRTIGFLTGVFAGFFVVMLICGWLNFALVSLVPQVQLWLEILGAAYMVYLAVHILLSKPMQAEEQQSGLNTFNAGFMMQFLNLKVILYGVTVYSLFITPIYQSPLAVSLFAPVLAAVGFIATSCWALGGDLLRSFLKKYYLAFNFTMAALLIYTALAGLLAGR
jgi:threonine/homoserine/homoserine lactone efflux protein